MNDGDSGEKSPVSAPYPLSGSLKLGKFNNNNSIGFY